MLEQLKADDINMQEYTSGLQIVLEKKDELKAYHYIKGQIAGIFTYKTGTRKEDDPSIIIDRALWQIKKLKEINQNVILFFDEPNFYTWGSLELAKNILNFYCIPKETNVKIGVHCCSNTDWALLLNSDLDIISFDAYNFSTNFLVYKKEISLFLEHGAIAWGIVPTLEKTTIQELENRIDEIILKLGVEPKKLLTNSLITPSCGLAYCTLEEAEFIANLTKEFSLKIKSKYLLE